MIYGLNLMEADTGISCSSEEQTLACSKLSNEGKKSEETGGSSLVFINHAVSAWHENRRKWIGDSSKRLQRKPKDPIISWTATYEDLLSTSAPFTEPIPLTEMVDFLVDIWHDEELYD